MTEREVLDRMFEVMNEPVTNLIVGIRVFRALENLGCKYIGDVAKLSPRILMAQKNFWKKSLKELEDALTERGLFLYIATNWQPPIVQERKLCSDCGHDPAYGHWSGCKLYGDATAFKG